MDAFTPVRSESVHTALSGEKLHGRCFHLLHLYSDCVKAMTFRAGCTQIGSFPRAFIMGWIGFELRRSLFLSPTTLTLSVELVTAGF